MLGANTIRSNVFCFLFVCVRQLTIIFMLGQTFILEAVIFQPATYFHGREWTTTTISLKPAFPVLSSGKGVKSNTTTLGKRESMTIGIGEEPSFFYTLYIVILTELFVMDVFFLIKLLVCLAITILCSAEGK